MTLVVSRQQQLSGNKLYSCWIKGALAAPFFISKFQRFSYPTILRVLFIVSSSFNPNLTLQKIDSVENN